LSLVYFFLRLQVAVKLYNELSVLFEQYHEFYQFFPPQEVHSILTLEDCLASLFILVSWIPVDSHFHYLNNASLPVLIENPSEWYITRILQQIFKYFEFLYQTSMNLMTKDLVKLTRLITEWFILLTNITFKDGELYWIDGIHDKTMATTPPILFDFMNQQSSSAQDQNGSGTIPSTGRPQQCTVLKRIIFELINKNVFRFPYSPTSVAAFGNNLAPAGNVSQRRWSGTEAKGEAGLSTSTFNPVNLLFTSHFFAIVHQNYKILLQTFQSEYLVYLPEVISKELLKESHPEVLREKLNPQKATTTTDDLLLGDLIIETSDEKKGINKEDQELFTQIRNIINASLSPSSSGSSSFDTANSWFISALSASTELHIFRRYKYCQYFPTIPSLVTHLNTNGPMEQTERSSQFDETKVAAFMKDDFLNSLEIILFLHDELLFLLEDFLMYAVFLLFLFSFSYQFPFRFFTNGLLDPVQFSFLQSLQLLSDFYLISFNANDKEKQTNTNNSSGLLQPQQLGDDFQLKYSFQYYFSALYSEEYQTRSNDLINYLFLLSELWLFPCLTRPLVFPSQAVPVAKDEGKSKKTNSKRDLSTTDETVKIDSNQDYYNNQSVHHLIGILLLYLNPYLYSRSQADHSTSTDTNYLQLYQNFMHEKFLKYLLTYCKRILYDFILYPENYSLLLVDSNRKDPAKTALKSTILTEVYQLHSGICFVNYVLLLLYDIFQVSEGGKYSKVENEQVLLGIYSSLISEFERNFMLTELIYYLKRNFPEDFQICRLKRSTITQSSFNGYEMHILPHLLSMKENFYQLFRMYKGEIRKFVTTDSRRNSKSLLGFNSDFITHSEPKHEPKTSQSNAVLDEKKKKFLFANSFTETELKEDFITYYFQSFFSMNFQSNAKLQEIFQEKNIFNLLANYLNIVFYDNYDLDHSKMLTKKNNPIQTVDSPVIKAKTEAPATLLVHAPTEQEQQNNRGLDLLDFEFSSSSTLPGTAMKIPAANADLFDLLDVVSPLEVAILGESFGSGTISNPITSSRLVRRKSLSPNAPGFQQLYRKNNNHNKLWKYVNEEFYQYFERIHISYDQLSLGLFSKDYEKRILQSNTRSNSLAKGVVKAFPESGCSFYHSHDSQHIIQDLLSYHSPFVYILSPNHIKAENDTSQQSAGSSTDLMNNLLIDENNEVFYQQISGSNDLLTVLMTTLSVNPITKILKCKLKVINSSTFKIPYFKVHLLLPGSLSYLGVHQNTIDGNLNSTLDDKKSSSSGSTSGYVIHFTSEHFQELFQFQYLPVNAVIEKEMEFQLLESSGSSFLVSLNIRIRLEYPELMKNNDLFHIYDLNSPSINERNSKYSATSVYSKLPKVTSTYLESFHTTVVSSSASKQQSQQQQKWNALIDLAPFHVPVSYFLKTYGNNSFHSMKYWKCHELFLSQLSTTSNSSSSKRNILFYPLGKVLSHLSSEELYTVIAKMNLCPSSDSHENILCCDLTLPWKAFESQLLRLSSCSRNSQYGSSSCSCVVPVSFTTKFSGASNEFPFILIEFLQNLQSQLFSFKGNSFTGNQLNNLCFPSMSINYSSCSIGWSLQTIWNHEISVLFQFDRSQDESTTKSFGGTTSNLPLVLAADSREVNRNTSFGAFSDADNTRSYNQFSGKLHIHCDEKPILLGILKDLDSFIAVLSGGFFFQC
jgi:hypothetical protein